MAVYQNVVALSNVTPTLIDQNVSTVDPVTGEKTYAWTTGQFSIQNLDNLANVFVGTSDVSTTNFGLRIAPGAIAAFDNLNAATKLYAVSSTNGSQVAVLAIEA